MALTAFNPFSGIIPHILAASMCCFNRLGVNNTNTGLNAVFVEFTLNFI